MAVAFEVKNVRYGYMTEQKSKLAAARKQKGLSQQQLADILGVHWITISKLERGKMRMTMEWLRRLADGLKVSPVEILELGRVVRSVELSGTIVHGYIVTGIDRDEQPPIEPIKVDDVNELVSQWFKIEGDELLPFYSDGDLVKATYFDPDDHPKLIGRLSAITLEDERTMLAVPTKHWKKRLFDLRTATGFQHKKVVVDQIGLITEHIIRQFPAEEI